MPTLAPEPLAAFVKSLFVSAGVPDESAAVVARSLVDANLCGHDSHGVMRAPQYVGFIATGLVGFFAWRTRVREGGGL